MGKELGTGIRQRFEPLRAATGVVRMLTTSFPERRISVGLDPSRLPTPEETAWNDVWGYDPIKFLYNMPVLNLVSFPTGFSTPFLNPIHGHRWRPSELVILLRWLVGGHHWRRPPYPIATADYATYVQILTWFLDTPSPEAPFSVHRMVLAGKKLGTDVGQWSGPSHGGQAADQLQLTNS
ncbi:hypothetical protein CPC08DRAFT_790057 [Agrocybe pediades]|nr:hypothetical protein CPC08DRAFT_790057 [Agrocybe pediades]